VAVFGRPRGRLRPFCSEPVCGGAGMATQNSMPRIKPRFLRAAPLLLTVFVLGVPGGAQAHRGPCADAGVARVFLPWGDPAWYASVPDGGLEAGGAGWALTNGAQIVSGNESYFVRSPGDSHALSLRPSSSATSAPACVGPGHPTMRFFVRGASTAQGVLTVSVKLPGDLNFVPIGVIAASDTWQPSPILPVVTNALALAAPQQAVFRFEAGGGGSWFVDDIYVDPYGKG
jgi:hypothetical protein